MNKNIHVVRKAPDFSPLNPNTPEYTEAVNARKEMLKILDNRTKPQSKPIRKGWTLRMKDRAKGFKTPEQIEAELVARNKANKAMTDSLVAQAENEDFLM